MVASRHGGRTRGSDRQGGQTMSITGRQQRGQRGSASRQWATDPRWTGIERTYSAEDVIRLRGSVQEEHTLARLGAERLWELLHTEDYINALGALTGNQAVQQVRAGLQGHLPVRLAGRRRRQPGRADLPGPEPVPGQLGAAGGPPDQQRAAARRPDHLVRGRRRTPRTGWRRSWPTRRPASAAC